MAQAALVTDTAAKITTAACKYLGEHYVIALHQCRINSCAELRPLCGQGSYNYVFESQIRLG